MTLQIKKVHLKVYADTFNSYIKTYENPEDIVEQIDVDDLKPQQIVLRITTNNHNHNHTMQPPFMKWRILHRKSSINLYQPCSKTNPL
jgi:hypothetical protein